MSWAVAAVQAVAGMSLENMARASGWLGSGRHAAAHVDPLVEVVTVGNAHFVEKRAQGGADCQWACGRSCLTHTAG